MGFALLYPSYNGYGGRGIARGRGGLQQCTRPHPKGPPHVALPALRCLPGIDAVLGVDVAAQPALVLAAGHLRRAVAAGHLGHAADRSEEHTSELQSLMRNSYAVFCLKKKNNNPRPPIH